MNEGRAGMNQVIHHYERQRAEALKLKQEAEIVLPYMRAAMEELDAQADTLNVAAARERVQPAVQEMPKPEKAPVKPQDAETFEPKRAEDRARPAAAGFGRASIASLIDQKTKKEGAAG